MAGAKIRHDRRVAVLIPLRPLLAIPLLSFFYLSTGTHLGNFDDEARRT